MSWRRTSVATLVVAAAALTTAIAGTVSAPTHAATAPLDGSTLSIRVAHTRIEAGDTTLIRGDLHVRGGQDSSGRTVTLEARAQGATSFTPVGTSVSGALGGVALEVAPTVSTRYRWTYAGDAATRPSRSGVARVRIVVDQHHPRRVMTSLSVRAAHRVVDADGSVLVRGRLRTHGIGLRHRTVSLMSRQIGARTAWQVMDQRLTDAFGAVQFQVRPTARSAYRLRFDGTPVFRPSHSGVVRIAVRPVVTAVATPRWIDPGATATVSGVASLAGQPLAGTTVDLVARPTGRHGSRQVVASGLTAADGSVTLTDTPVVSTVYRLVVRHSAGVPRGASPAVRVKVCTGCGSGTMVS